MSVITFKHKMPTADTMEFEELFHEGLALEPADKADLLAKCDYKVWMFVGGRLAGETYAIRPAHFDERIEDTEDHDGWRCAYVYSTAILQEFQGKGFGKLLKAHLLGYLKGAPAVEYAIGHALEGPSVELNKSFGARMLVKHDDWYGTGKSCWFYRQDL